MPSSSKKDKKKHKHKKRHSVPNITTSNNYKDEDDDKLNNNKLLDNNHNEENHDMITKTKTKGEKDDENENETNENNINNNNNNQKDLEKNKKNKKKKKRKSNDKEDEEEKEEHNKIESKVLNDDNDGDGNIIKNKNKKSVKNNLNRNILKDDDEEEEKSEEERNLESDDDDVIDSDKKSQKIEKEKNIKAENIIDNNHTTSDLDNDESSKSKSEEDDDTKKQKAKSLITAKNEKDNKIKSEEEESNDTSLITSSTFESLGVHPSICKSAQASGWTHATKIQKETLPYAIQKRDIIGLAETGSGKTGTFAIPILQSLLEETTYKKSIYAVVLAPTRELAFQIQDVFQALGSSIGMNSVCVVGGVDMSSQAIALARLPHVVIATPGRLLDHLQNTKGFHLSNIKFLILDEADRMLSLDFEEEINHILSVIPDSNSGRQTMLFSATMTSKVDKLQRASLYNPIRIEVSTKFQTPDTLLQYYLFIPAKYKDCYFTYLVANECKSKSMLVFVATCNNAQRLALLLRNLGLNAICLHGQMNQSKRLGALHKFKSGVRDILICTDVASRGLDIPHVDVVINYDLPNHGKDYIHRVGRTARAGRSGLAYALVTQYDVEVYQRLEGLLGYKLPEYTLSEELVLILLERVNEAQRLANRELREQLSSFQGKKRRRGGKINIMDEDGMENEIQKEFSEMAYKGGSGGFGGALPNQRGSGRNSKKYRHKK